MATLTIKIDNEDIQIQNLDFDGIISLDSPDFCDAFVCSAEVKGEDGEWRGATNEELDKVNEDSAFISENLHSFLY